MTDWKTKYMALKAVHDSQQGQLHLPPYQRHSPASLAAAAAVDGARNETCRLQVLEYIYKMGGATDAEIQGALKMDGNSERPRRVALTRAGLIEDSGRTRPTPSGRQAVVWQVCSSE
tara:strand:+ start:2949 stop:3299 length:351 start_codon:yes stop_codon:yes gene_type:complete